MHLCPDCLHKWKKKGKIKTLENYRLLWDNVALYISMGSFLMFYFAFITAPFVIYITIRHWKSPTSIMGRTKIRFIFAFLFATIQIVGMSVLVYTIVT